MKLLAALLFAFAVAIAPPCFAGSGTGSGYDPSADPAAALEQALATAAASQRKVLVIAGGDWCSWCLRLNKFFADNADVKAELERAFVTIKVYRGDENDNDAFFDTLPAAQGYPHFWVISAGGKNVQSYSTAPLENGKGYDKQAVLRFIQEAGASQS